MTHAIRSRRARAELVGKLLMLATSQKCDVAKTTMFAWPWGPTGLALWPVSLSHSAFNNLVEGVAGAAIASSPAMMA
jgi:hypothetical protein